MNEFLRVPDWPDVWAVGDCAFVPDIRNPGKSHPPTAQHAIREGKIVAQNIAATLVGRPLKSFSFKTIGLLASIGRRSGVARIFGFNFSGFFAWWLWRTVYLSKLPGLDKKIRVAFDWTLDLLFPKDVCAVYDSTIIVILIARTIREIPRTYGDYQLGPPASIKIGMALRTRSRVIQHHERDDCPRSALARDADAGYAMSSAHLIGLRASFSAETADATARQICG